MNTHRRFIVTLVGIITTCVMSAGAASAKPAPDGADVPSKPSRSLVEAEQGAAPATGDKARAQHLQQQQGYIEHLQRMNQEGAVPTAGSPDAARRAGVNRGGSVANQGTTSHPTPSTPSESGNDLDIPVLAVTALAGLALGAAGSTASRRLRRPTSGLAA